MNSMRRVSLPPQGLREHDATPSQVDSTREAIIERVPELERLRPHGPRAVELAAEATAALHDAINGHAVEYCGNREPKYFREMLRGERPITWEDTGRLAIETPARLAEGLKPFLLAIAEGAPQALVAILADVAPVAGFHLAPGSRPRVDAIDAAAGLTGLAGPTAEAVIRDARDGSIDDRAGHLDRIRALKEQVAQLEAAVSAEVA